MNLRYRIPEISAMQVLSAIEEKDGQLYLYLDPEDLSRDYLVNQTLQDDCPMFFQAMRVLGEKIEVGGICDALFHALYMWISQESLTGLQQAEPWIYRKRQKSCSARKAYGSTLARVTNNILPLNALPA